MSRTNGLIASRAGMILAGLGLIMLAFGMANISDQASRSIAKDVELLNEREIRNGFVAMNEIQRLNLTVFGARGFETLTDAQREALQSAVDFLFVRREHIKSVYPRPEAFPPSIAVIESLDTIIEISDAYLAMTETDYQAFLGALIDASNQARRALNVYLTELNREQEKILTRQSQILLSKTRYLWAGVAALSLVSAVAMLLLRREVLSRRAREEAEERVRFLAFFDPLTKLPNRVQLQDRLEEYLKERAKIAVGIVDVDNFKSVNDTYGHAVGDAILRHVADILAPRAKDLNGFVARLSGDEFAVVIPTDDIGSLKQYCNDVIAQAARPHTFENETIATGVSIGLATTSQLSSAGRVEISSVLRAADFSLYSAKAEGRGCFMFYDNELAAQLEERNAMLEALPDAIANGDLRLFLQPKVSLPEGTVIGFEALVRWQRGDRLVPPSQFITLAEESGLIVDIDICMLKQAIQRVGDWNASHGTSFGVSVNLSGVHFSNSLIVDHVRDALETSSLAPELLTLEITESTQLHNGHLVQGILSAFRALGTRISIDDFGAGYSSLAYLRSIGADELKIDRSLVSEIHESQEAAFVLDAVIDLAQNLNMDVIVEGIENPDQARAIHQMGVSTAQGFLFGTPEPAEQALSEATKRAAHPPPQLRQMVDVRTAQAK